VPPSRDPFPSVPQAALLLLAGFILQYLLGALLYDLREPLGLTRDQMGALAMLLGNGIVVALVLQVRRTGYRDLMHPSPSSPWSTLLVLSPPVLLLLPLVLLLDVALMTLLETLFPVSAWEAQAFGDMVAPSLASFVATCVIAPVVEEMLFRGILLRAFLERYPRGQAIAYSALFFGAAHLNVYQFFLAFFLGLLFGWLYERSRSLLPGIVLHAGVNISITVMAASNDPDTTTPLAWGTAAVAATLGTLALRRLLRPRVLPADTATPDAP
jgi:uncharacterized protein